MSSRTEAFMTTTQERVSDEKINASADYAPSGNRSGNAVVKVLGIGGAGCNVVSRAYDSGMTSADYFCLNTDQQYLNHTIVPNKIVLGPKATAGMGTGGFPEMGLRAAEENRSEIERAVEGADLVILVAGLGGGAGTGALPLVAEIARDAGATVAVSVTEPFDFEVEDRVESSRQTLRGCLKRLARCQSLSIKRVMAM
jgi:cell division protein FtsZ